MAISITGGNTANAQDVSDLESLLGHQLSPQFKAFLQSNDGAEPEDNIFDIGSDKSSGVSEFIPAAQIAQERALLDDLGAGAYPIAWDDCGNYVVIDESKQGAVFFWDHEIEGGLTKLASGFQEFLDLLKPFDPDSVELKPGQVLSAWIDSDFLNSLKKK
jgi:hypothetical protein